MKWSVFIFKFDVDLEVVLFNTKNTGIVAIDIDKYDDISIALDDPSHALKYLDEFNQLVELGFIVDSGIDEYNDFFKSVLDSRENDTALSVALMPTTNCNFTCKYCYEDGIQKTIYMSETVANAFISYIKKYVCDNNIKSIDVTLYGGEPTLSWEIAIDTLTKLKQVCLDAKIELYTSIITNGYLFDKQKVLDLLPFNFSSAQITLDGTKEFHDVRRQTTDQLPTFDVIMNNLHDLVQISESITVSIRVNCDSENIKSVPDLAEYITTNFKGKRVFLNFGYIFQHLGKSETINQDDPKTSDTMMSENSFIEQLPQLYKILSKFGIRIPEFYSFDNFCMAKSKHSFTLHPSGDIYKCISEAGRTKCKFGNIFKDSSVGSYFQENLYKDCIAKMCCFLPLCHTGCPYHAQVKYGDASRVFCRRKQLEDINIRFIIENM